MKLSVDGNILLDIIFYLSALMEGNTKFDGKMKNLPENFSLNVFFRITWYTGLIFLRIKTESWS